MPKRPVVVFVSAGRCGTQWLVAGLRELHPAVEARHEPIGPLYRPRQYFRRYDDPEAIADVPEVAEHVEAIAACQRPYVETGWPLFAVVPLLASRMPDRLRVVHLTRHPAPSAMSHLSHQTYAGSPREDAYTRLATLSPSDGGVFQPDYRGCWDRLTPYEKCLFWWTEIHAFGLELAERLPGIPLLRVRSEAMLAGDRAVLEQLLEFLELSFDDGWNAHATRVVDRWHHHTPEAVDAFVYRRHRLTVEVARRLEYEPSEIDLAALEGRYLGAPDPGLDRIGRFEEAPVRASSPSR